MDKALVKSTGELLDIKAAYITMQINIELPDSLLESLRDITDTNNISVMNSDSSVNFENTDDTPSDYYLLSDNNQYDKSSVVVGIENIREYKLQTLNEKPNS